MEPLTTEEAKQLINLAKQTLLDVLNSPDKGADVEFNADSIQTKDSFIIKIFRGKINKEKYNYGARIAKNGIILLELHINALSSNDFVENTLLFLEKFHIVNPPAINHQMDLF